MYRLGGEIRPDARCRPVNRAQRFRRCSVLTSLRSVRLAALASVAALAFLAARPTAARAQSAIYLNTFMGVGYYCNSGGLRVVYTSPGRPVHEAGIRVGNLITSV